MWVLKHLKHISNLFYLAPKSIIYVMIRPGAIDFIKTMSKYYEIVVFTASMQGYARPVVEKLDPEGH